MSSRALVKRASAQERNCDGCGKRYVARAWKIRGINARFCNRSCANASLIRPRGPASHRWRGGRFLTNEGYVRVADPRRGTAAQTYKSHPYVLEHRLVMERELGRRLKRNETVHHRNGRRDDNRLENLELRVGAHGQGATHAHCSTCTCFEHDPLR